MTDWKALCEELLGLWDAQPLPPYKSSWASVIARTRAALAQPEPEAVEPSDEELLKLAEQAAHIDDGCLADAMANGYPLELGAFDILEICRAVIAADRARHGRPAPAAAGEVAELVAALKVIDKMQQEWVLLGNDDGTASPSLTMPISLRRFTVIRDALTRAADLLERQAAPVPLLSDGAQVIEPTKHTILVPVPVPVAVSERPWDREGWCDEQGRCWWGRPETDDWYSDWTLASHESVQEFCTYNPMRACLPAHALPLPAGEVQP